MGYEYTTAEATIDSILSSLRDSEGVFHSREEVLSYINEGLRVFNSFSFSNKVKTLVPIVAGDSILDLTTKAQVTNENGFNVTIQSVLDELYYHLMEYVGSDATDNKRMYDTSTFRTHIEKSYNELLVESNLLFALETQENLTVPVSQEIYSEQFLDIKRVVFKDVESKRYLLSKQSKEDIFSFLPTYYDTKPIPKYYTLSTSPRLVIEFIPSIDNFGTLELIVLKAAAAYAALSNVKLYSDLVWILKYKTLYELFSQNGEGFDPLRAQYCKNRWMQGLELARNYQLILTAKINDRFVNFDSIEDWDAFNPSWINETKKPTGLGMIGSNILALNGKANDIYSLELEILAEASTIIDEEDEVQISREFLPALEDYILHLCAFKSGGGPFIESLEKGQALYRMALLENSRFSTENKELNINYNKGIVIKQSDKPIKELMSTAVGENG